MKKRSLPQLLRDVRACRICEPHLDRGVRPVLRASSSARVLVAGQAPGTRVHASGIPFDDPSGDRLREWMGIASETFYDETRVAIVPMGFCYPGTGKSGDLPPRPECAATWHDELLARLPQVRLTLVIGRYAMDYHLDNTYPSVTEAVRAWKEERPARIPLPHPSPRNNRWLRDNPWFAEDVLPYVRRRCRELLR